MLLFYKEKMGDNLLFSKINFFMEKLDYEVGILEVQWDN
jgi:hypothetical protein